MGCAVVKHQKFGAAENVGHSRLRPTLSWLWVSSAAAPFLVAAIVYAATGHLVLGGDQALLALDATDARHGNQTLGPYSRMGWSHPGPIWLYLLAPTFWLLGSTGSALVAASLLVHALFAGLLVAAAGREHRWQQPLMAGVVLLYALRMPADLFAIVWNPYALLLPALLLLVLAARATAGHIPALGGTVAVGTFLVHSHVGSVPLVGAVGAVAVLGAIIQWRRADLQSGGRRGRWLTGAALLVTAAMWAAPVWQQLRPAGRGNLAWLADYFIHGDPNAADQTTYGWVEAITAVGQLLGIPVYGWSAAAGELDTSRLTLLVLLAVAAQLVGSVALIIIGRRLRTPLPAIGLITAASTVAALVAAKMVTGEMQNYLLIWATILPAALMYGWLLVAAQVLSLGRRRRWPDAAAVVAALVGGVIVSVSLINGTFTLRDQPGVHAASRLALKALPVAGADGPTVFLDIASPEAWPTSTGVALELEQAGYRVAVNESWVKLFGRDRATDGTETWRVTVVAAWWAPQMPFGPVLGTVPMETGEDAAIIVNRVGA